MGANILDQKQALESFFDSLMRDVDAYAENESQQDDVSKVIAPDSAEEKEPAPRIVNLQPVESPAVEVSKVAEIQTQSRPVRVKEEISVFETMPAVAPPEVELRVEETTEVISDEIIEATTQIEEQTSSEQQTGRPEWAEGEFQAMLFKVAGLTLAVPLVELHGIVEWDSEKITQMPGHTDFYIGLMTHLDKKIPVVNTARLILPPDKLTKLAGEESLQRISRIVLINDSQYGLACDEVNEVITLRPDEVKWRTKRTQRPWLAGTVVEHMCALLDAQAFAELLSNRAPVDDFRE